jgi:release factor glutamine methyltransferase
VKQSLREKLAQGVERLRAAGIASARLDARVLLAEVLERPPDKVLLFDEAGDDQFGKFEMLLARRANREPLAYITGHKEFWSLDFEVGPGVLIPRPESETLVEQALLASRGSKRIRVLDLGTGSGCLLIAFLADCPNASGVGVDSSGAALAYARRNASRHRLGERCKFFQSGWAAPELASPRQMATRSSGVVESGLRAPSQSGIFSSPRFRDSACNSFEAPGDEGFDIILVNPPYLTEKEFDLSEPEIRDHEPRAAFAAGPDGLDAIRTLAPELVRQLKPNGLAFVEIGAGQATAAGEVLAAAGLELTGAVPDLCGTPRCLIIGRAEDGSHRAPKNSVGKRPVTG